MFEPPNLEASPVSISGELLRLTPRFILSSSELLNSLPRSRSGFAFPVLRRLASNLGLSIAVAFGRELGGKGKSFVTERR